MPYYDRIDVSEGINVNNTSYQKSVIFGTICIFLDKGLKSRPDFCNGYYDVLMMSMNLAISLF